MLYSPCCIYFLSIINQLEGGHSFYISNTHCLFYNKCKILIIYWFDKTNLSILFWFFYIFTLSVIKQSKCKTCFRGLFLVSMECTTLLSIFFGLPLIFSPWIFSFDWKIVDCFPCLFAFIRPELLDPDTCLQVC